MVNTVEGLMFFICVIQECQYRADDHIKLNLVYVESSAIIDIQRVETLSY